MFTAECTSFMLLRFQCCGYKANRQLLFRIVYYPGCFTAVVMGGVGEREIGQKVEDLSKGRFSIFLNNVHHGGALFACSLQSKSQ